MGNSYCQIGLHIVFAVKNRDIALDDIWRKDLFSYISGIILKSGHSVVIVGGWRDHVHIYMKANAEINIPALIREIKLSSNQWIQPKMRCRFGWQRGYACFSVSDRHSEALKHYIETQEEHHRNVPLADEFRRLLTVNGVRYEEKYLPIPE